MHYDKQIRYLEYLENGEKIRSAGFIKIEIIDNLCNIQVNVTGLHPSENCTREVRLIGIDSAETVSAMNRKEGILGEIALQSGKGSLIKRRIPIDSLCEGISYDDLAAVRMNLGKSRELLCRWREETPKEPLKESKESIKESQASPQAPLKEPEEPVKEPQELLKEPKELAETAAPTGRAEMPQQQAWMQEVTQPLRPEAGPTMPATLHEKKWRQLSEIYPHIAPFRDERDYISIGPGDFVILPEKYYRLINNSFLLHGFYNYGHMVLARMMKRGEEKYYIGVPGNFYEKERQVAIMFGFESFECRQEPARDGDFGYYMIRVEL